jgi:serine/threonine protein kinase
MSASSGPVPFLLTLIPRYPNLCPVHDVGELDGRHYLTMTYVEGQTLSDARAELSQAEAIRIVGTIARALQVAHDAGIVHRDLKPSNVMLNTRGEPIVMDFGLASREGASESELTQSGTIIGSPAYMAPEQVEAAHDKIGPRTDVYALGVILYQLLTGRCPFEGAGMSVLGQISSGTRPPAPSELAEVDSRVEAICLKAMSHEAADRYQTAIELADALDRITEQAADQSRKQQLSPRSGLRTIVAVSGLLLVICAVVVIPRWTRDDSDSVVAPPHRGPVLDTPVTLLSTAKSGLPDTSPLLPGPFVPTRSSTGRFVDSGQELGNSNAYAVAAGDVDGDGDVDMFVANSPRDQPNQIWLNDGKGFFSKGQELEGLRSSDVELGDLDNDGDLDAFVACWDEPSVIWRNDGSGRFEKFGETEAFSTQCLALGDVDGDGDLDAVFGGRPGTPSNRVLLNNGAAEFVDSGQRLGESQTLGIALADLDADGDLDVFAANWILSYSTFSWKLWEWLLNSGAYMHWI